MNYLASPPLVVAYALAGTMDIDLDRRTAGHGRRRQAGLPPRRLADATGDPARDRGQRRLGHVQAGLFERVPGRRALEPIKVPQGQIYRWEPALDLRAQSALLRRNEHDAGRRCGHTRRARAGAARRFRDHRSHLARRQHLEDEPGGEVPRRAGRAAGRLQLLRRAARQSRSDDARHLREHPPAQRARARHRGRRHGAHTERRADEHLRRGDALQGGGHAARSSSRARNTAPARRATGPRRARCCSA